MPSVTELTTAIQQAAARCRVLLTGIAEAAPDANVHDQATALTELGTIERRLSSRRLKRRVLQPDRPDADDAEGSR
jgi:hypothetical protein